MHKILMILTALVALCGCPQGEEAADPGQIACDQVTAEATAITAGDTMDNAAPLTISTTPYDVTLVDGGMSYLKVEVAEDTHALFFVGATDVVADIYKDGEAQGLATAGEDALCAADIPAHWHLDLAPGTWTIELNDVALGSLWVLLMSGEGADHSDE